MSKNKAIFGALLALVLVAVQVVSVAAAPAAQTSTVDGTVQSCTTATDPLTGAIIVVCTLTLTDGSTQTVRLSAADAQTLGLATVNPDGSVTITAVAGQLVSIASTMILADPCVLPTGSNQPVGSALTSFFCTTLGLDYNTIQGLHDQGFGYGVIAQACFMAQALGGTGMTCEAILTAKQTGDYSGLTLPNGVIVTNWGQLRKAIFGGVVAKNACNLGAVMSGRASNAPCASSSASTTSGNSVKTHGHSNGHSNGKGNGD